VSASRLALVMELMRSQILASAERDVRFSNPTFVCPLAGIAELVHTLRRLIGVHPP
jgi:hypothetical protein